MTTHSFSKYMRTTRMLLAEIVFSMFLFMVEGCASTSMVNVSIQLEKPIYDSPTYHAESRILDADTPITGASFTYVSLELIIHNKTWEHLYFNPEDVAFTTDLGDRIALRLLHPHASSLSVFRVPAGGKATVILRGTVTGLSKRLTFSGINFRDAAYQRDLATRYEYLKR